MLKIAFSPCPNDTYIFGAWVKGLIKTELKMGADLLDIESLNLALRRAQYPLQKVSALTAFQCLDTYEILPMGGALGFGVGPIVVSKKGGTLQDLSGKKIALPGEGTTANFLFQLFGPVDVEPYFARYDQIIPLIQKGEVDAGVLIHEGRFILEREGLKLVEDLGSIWEEQEGLPLPLGVLAIRKDFKERELAISTIHHSLSFARGHLQEIYPYILQHAQEKNPEIIEQHISLYVTGETGGYSGKGQRALQRFYERGLEIGLFSSEETPFRPNFSTYLA